MMRSEQHLYVARRAYTVFTFVGLSITLLLVWTLIQAFDWVTLIFLSFAALFAMINLRWMFTRAELTPSGLTLYEPLIPPTHVDFRQMVVVYEAGRAIAGISLVYYPLAGNGLVNMDDPRTLYLPAMQNQEELLSILDREIPE
ncbi:MAG: hypothetical protein KF893_02875 [Caldilineaceae bacterium]|nr:hypothetical protein [Caldilineaceae bacterium]